MIKVKKANQSDCEVLALLGRVTYIESHGHFIDNKIDLTKYVDNAFSFSQTQKDILSFNHVYYIIYVDDLPVGYSKLVLDAEHKDVNLEFNCRLERIYILKEFIPLKIGQKLFDYTEERAKELKRYTMWLSVYIKNNRAIKFYKKNGFVNVGELNFLVNGKTYENIVLEKNI